MGDEPYTMQRMTSSRVSTRSTSPHQAAYAAERAKVLFGSYRRGDANDPDAYVAAITAVLACFETDLIREVTDPRTGIATTEKFMSFMPNAGELKVYCDGVAAKRARIQKFAALPAPNFQQARLAPPPRHRADCFICATHPRYTEAVSWTAGADKAFWRMGESPDGRRGVWVCFDEFDRPKRYTAPPAAPPVEPSNQAEEINMAEDDPDAWRTEVEA